MDALAKWFMKTGSLLVLAGLVLMWMKRRNWLGVVGHVPGDVRWKVGSSHMRLPIGSGLLALVLLTIYMNTGRRR